MLIKKGWDARALAGGYEAWRKSYPVDEVPGDEVAGAHEEKEDLGRELDRG